MTTLAAQAPGASRPRTTVRPSSFGRLVAAEWVKFRSLRSTWWTLAVGAVLMIALAVLQTWGTSTIPDDIEFPNLSGAVFVTGGAFLGQLAFCVLGVLAITGEYSTGMIRSTFAAAPRRLPVLWAKLVVIFSAVLLVSVLAVALSWVGSMPWFDELGLAIDLGNSDDLRIMLGTPLYLATATALAFAIGALVRHSAAGLAIVLGLLLVVEQAFALIPWRPLEVISPFLPSTAGSRLTMDAATQQMMDAGSDVATLTPWQGYGVLVAWVVVLLALAAVLMRRRDA
ncbi:ABC transporter permease subunit [Actinotalea ferrariae]|uniref:ABC transporter permease n=1 Tax=Actinotalea ferrariae TaxID=1386098 RepID=UPI001C8C8CD0|nr:ABC transporter permease [Actinotalea ferrariae]MBX9246144.1 ABC transporter permease subunit [Actinotalea ferrariae]